MTTFELTAYDNGTSGTAASGVCRSVLAELPDFFGLPEANEDYERHVSAHTTIVASLDDTAVDSTAIGLVSLLRHPGASVEIHLLAVRPQLHRCGVGAALVERAERIARDEGAKVLQVKTLGPSREDAGYARTRSFYEAVGFLRVEEFPTLWDEANPALLLIKPLVR